MATTITQTRQFTTNEQVTSAKLNDIASSATLSTIADSDLATITTAGKVNVSALTVSSQAAADIIVASGATTWKRLAKGTGLQVLRMNSGATDLEWAAPSTGADDAIVRGYELVYASTTTVTIQAGVLYVGLTKVTKTANTTLNITTDAHYIGGTSQRGASKWLYIYVDDSGNILLEDSTPTKADTAGNTDGTLIYGYYTTTYYRCVGAVLLDGSQNILKFSQNSTTEIFWDAPITELTTGASATYADVDCTSSVPAIATMALLFLTEGAGGASFLRMNGATADWHTVATSTYDQVWMPLDSGQIFEYKTGGTLTVTVMAYKLKIR